MGVMFQEFQGERATQLSRGENTHGQDNFPSRLLEGNTPLYVT
jgi:hypothetical protein